MSASATQGGHNKLGLLPDCQNVCHTSLSQLSRWEVQIYQTLCKSVRSGLVWK